MGNNLYIVKEYHNNNDNSKEKIFVKTILELDIIQIND